MTNAFRPPYIPATYPRGIFLLQGMHFADKTKHATKESAHRRRRSLICWALEKEFAAFGLVHPGGRKWADALAELRRQLYDIVFLDIHLPDANGIELLRGDRQDLAGHDHHHHERRRQRRRTGNAPTTAGRCNSSKSRSTSPKSTAYLKSTSGKYPHRRKHPRHICRIPLRISIVDPAPEEALYDLHNLSGTMADVGSGGIRLRTEYPLRVGQSVRAHAGFGVRSCPEILPRKPPPRWCGSTPRRMASAGLKFVS